MFEPRVILALAGPPQAGDPSPWPSLVLMAVIFGIFYFILILPMRNKQRKAEEAVKAMKAGDKVIVTPGIYGIIDRVDDTTFQIRIDEKTNTRIKVLKSAVAGLQGPDTEKSEK
jgi:preprotein translocase subunit YajC